MNPEGAGKVLIGSTKFSIELSGIFDISYFLGKQPVITGFHD
jgi:hypothetical protein